MSRERRMELIEKIEESCQGPVVVYITGDRIGLETKIASDIFPMIHRHLMNIGNKEKINLFLYSTGGITIAGYTLVNLFREFCDNFNVIIPFKAHSCATLICLGADNVIMTPIGQLSPIDPSIDHPMGPYTEIPGQANGRAVRINVEDVNGFIDLAKKEFGLSSEESLEKVFEVLASKVHPLALGSVQRTRSQIAFLAKNLMKYHCDDDEKIEGVVNTLIRERFSHDYIISRREAEKILKLNIVRPDEDSTRYIMDLFQEYENILELNASFIQENMLGENNSTIETFNRSIIESKDLTHVFRTKIEIRRTLDETGSPVPNGPYPERIMDEGWFEDGEL